MLCNDEISNCGNTTNLHRHLKEKHSSAYEVQKGRVAWKEAGLGIPEDEVDNAFDDVFGEPSNSTAVVSF